MRSLLLRWGITAVAVAVAAWVVPGIHVYGPHRVWTVLVVALVLGLINAFIRPVLYACRAASSPSRSASSLSSSTP